MTGAYTVHLIVEVEGPDLDWDVVAQQLALVLPGRKFKVATKRQMEIVSAILDEAEEVK